MDFLNKMDFLNLSLAISRQTYSYDQWHKLPWHKLPEETEEDKFQGVKKEMQDPMTDLQKDRDDAQMEINLKEKESG